MTASRTPPNPRRSAGRTILVIVGALLVLFALALLAGGGALVAVHETHRDGDGFYTTAGPPVSTPTHALVSDRLDLTGAPSWLFRKSRLGTIRVAATGTRAKPIFVGVARADRVDAYLRDSGLTGWPTSGSTHCR